MNIQIQAQFKNVSVKGVNAVLQFEIVGNELNALPDLVKLVSQRCFVSIESEQMELPIEAEDVEDVDPLPLELA